MAGRRPQRIGSVQSAGITVVDDPQVARAFEETGVAIARLERARSRETKAVDLVVGLNKVRHSLGRAVAGYTLVATVADAAFAHAIDLTNPRPDLEVWIRIIGVDQPDAQVETW